MKTVPKHIKEKLARMTMMHARLIELNMEVEEWMEKNGIENAFDFAYDYRESLGYAINDRDGFIDILTEALNQ